MFTDSRFEGDTDRLEERKSPVLAGLFLLEAGVKGRWKSLCGDEARLSRRLLARLSGRPASETGVNVRRKPFGGEAGRLPRPLPGLLVALSAGEAILCGSGFMRSIGAKESSSPVNGGERLGPKDGGC